MEKQLTVMIEEGDHWLVAYVTVLHEKSDDSFDHAFGTKRQTSIFPSKVIIDQVFHGLNEVVYYSDEIKDEIVRKALYKAEILL